jgi:hypothetical protein
MQAPRRLFALVRHGRKAAEDSTASRHTSAHHPPPTNHGSGRHSTPASRLAAPSSLVKMPWSIAVRLDDEEPLARKRFSKAVEASFSVNFLKPRSPKTELGAAGTAHTPQAGGAPQPAAMARLQLTALILLTGALARIFLSVRNACSSAWLSFPCTS